jgi:hypothetical protein
LKKLLSAVLLLTVLILLSGGIFIFNRYRQNPEMVFPFPYEFEQSAQTLVLDAPIVIVGDRMGSNFARYQQELAQAISINLSKPIKIQNLAQEGAALHRTIHQLKSLGQWPQILIYQGGSEEFGELKFRPQEKQKIKRNFDRYRDDRIETLMLLYPPLSRIVYDPIERVKLKSDPLLRPELSEEEYLDRLDTELLIFEQQLIHLVNMTKDRNSLLILTTIALNPDVPPKKVCEFATTLELEKELLTLKELLNSNNPKMAYASSVQLIKQHSANAQLFFLHGQIAKRLGLIDEAKLSLLEASAYDCQPWRASEVQNSIIRKVARDHQVILFDFAKLVEKDWGENVIFADEIFPQHLYYERGMQQLGTVIKDILKL